MSTSRVLRFLTVASVLCVSVASYAADTCKHRIHFLPQTHRTGDADSSEFSPTLLNQVASSQLKIADWIARFPKRPIFTEQLGNVDLSADQIPDSKRKKSAEGIHAAFPNGLPTHPSALNEIQKQTLANYGGEILQLLTGTIKSVNGVVLTKQEYDRIWEPLDQWLSKHPNEQGSRPLEIQKLIYADRERATLEKINDFLKKNPETRDVALVYGSNHHFGLYPDLFPPECVVVPREFAYDWLGAFRTNSNAFGDNRERESSRGAK